MFPAYAAGASALLILLQLVVQSKPVRKLHARFTTSEVTLTGDEDYEVEEPLLTPKDTARPSKIAQHVEQLGGPIMVGYKVVRFLSCLVLLGLSISTVVSGKYANISVEFPSLAQWPQFAICAIYAYTSLLALLSVVAPPALGRLATRYLVLVLALTWGVYVYRDVWPLATYFLTPVDAPEGPLLWAKFSVLTLAAVVVPLFIPRQYVPVDPKDPMPASPEQVASIVSSYLFSWLDSTIMAANRTDHLTLDELPVIADYDTTKHLVERSFPHLDPFQLKKPRYLFWGLMRVFGFDYLDMACMLIIRAISAFSSPLAVYQLLHYLETNGNGATVRPWFWIFLLLLGPAITSVTWQRYIFIATHVLSHVQAIVTQLVFDHSLRIRVKAEVGDSGKGGDVTVVPTPDTASIAEPSAAAEDSHEAPASGSGSEDGTSHSSTLSVDTTSKGKQKSATPPESPDSKKAAPADSKTGNVIGKINNLVTTDLTNLVDGRDFLMLILAIPLNIVISVIFVYRILGWSAFPGMAAMIVLFPVPGYVANLIQGVQTEKMKKTDARVQNVTESMSLIRMIKLFGWEPRVAGQLAEKREVELEYQKKYKLLELYSNLINHVLPIVTMIVSFVVFTVVMKRQLTAAIVFSSMSVFDELRAQIYAKVSLDRVNEFLYTTELLDEFADKTSGGSEIVFPKTDIDSDVIGIRAAAFTWANDNDGSLTPGTPGTSKRNFTLRIEDDLIFKRGCINLIVGPTGSGKTSLLMALLGELHYIPSGPDSFYSLPRAGGVAYASQESWVQNETIKDNILFGAPFEEERYNKVIEQCSLKRDLQLFDAGDLTEVGEKGLTLSGGQKARITLARAVYSSAEILLFDDVLAALDVHTARWIVERCFKGDLIRGRTVLLVTHNVAMASPIADFVVSLGSDGRLSSQGSLSKALAKDKKLSAEVAEESEEVTKADQEVDEPTEKKSDGKLVVAEEVAWDTSAGQRVCAVKMFFLTLGGSYPLLFWAVFTITLLLQEIFQVAETWFLGYWAQQYDERPASEIQVAFYIAGYSGLLMTGLAFYGIAYIVYVYGSLRAARKIHETLIATVLGTTLRWLDMTPTSRIIARCTQDIAAVDGQVAMYFQWLVELTLSMVMKLLAVVALSPIFIIPGIFVAIIGAGCGQLYIKAQLSVKREQSNARAPVLGHFGAAIAGLTSIRAYGAQSAFREESYKRTSRYTRVSRSMYNLNRWVSIRIETLSALYTAALAAYLVYGNTVKASNVGFSLNMAVNFSTMILWWVRIFNEFEVSGNSLERIQQYVVIEQEPKPTESGVPPAYWPASGDLKEGPRVLHDISFEVKSGERVGIVGRTGSGKSSLTLSLLRCIVTEGKVYYDGLPTDALNLDALRSKITIIPQVPELLGGNLRQNLDPFDEHDDATLNDALRAAGLFSVQNETDEGRITLDSQISSGGSNLSVGQRQILALARAIVRQSKLLILDEATSAIDYETDTVIQTSLRRELNKDVTLITVAHRLQTIMDADKIMVLDAGRIAEFGKPSELLQNEKGFLRSLVDESGDKEALYAMANGTRSST
ncbi:hypothetical protein B0H21DRAFT_822934 [Amylocystis lapponica]|nr:hypothetical protein B0H21DRAFT_822934 [Amylocystis lapponica]